jgi:hypothetical protein
MAHNFARKLFQIHDTFHVRTIAAPAIGRKQYRQFGLLALSSISKLDQNVSRPAV